MPPGRKQGGGCWTCRLRRQRCDGVRPICGNCKHLDVTCYSGEVRPSWMDGGAGQKHMSEMMKAKIKHNAPFRREKRCFTHGHPGQGMIVATPVVPTSNPRATSLVSDTTVEHVSPADSITSILSVDSVESTTVSCSVDRLEKSQASSTIASSSLVPITLPIPSTPGSSGPAGLAVPISWQLGSVMIYLDYVFPFLFPFYQPPLIETGRQWLLGLLCQNEVSFHIAASLSAYFFSLIPQNGEQDMHDECKALVRDRLLEQMESAVRSMQTTVSAISHHGPQIPLLDRTRVMEEIIQLLMVEVTVQRNVDWRIHLTPALALFDEIFKTHGTECSEPSLAVLLSALPALFPTASPHQKPLPNTADQSALVFFVSLLLFVDIVASTSLGTPPTLKSYHSVLLSSHGEDKCCVRLEAIIGCQNWALVAIGNISALCAWKREAKQSGNFSVFNLVNLATPISQSLEEGLNNLDIATISYQPKKVSANWLEGYYGRHDRAISDTSIASTTRIWAYAAKIYLFVSLSGWQANSTDIQASVAKVLNLLQTVESPAQLQGLSWPIAVAGCLALPSQEHDFRRVIGVVGQLREFGTLLSALGIMEAVWRSRDSIDRDVWDIASGLCVLGSPALLL